MLKRYLNSWWVFSMTLVLLIALATSSNWLLWLGWIAPLEKLKSVYTLKNTNYEYSPVISHAVKTMHVSVPNNEQVTTISLRFKVAALHGYMDLFQTAPFNSGIRAELDRHGALAIVVANRSNQKFSALQLAPHLTLNEWHTLKLIVWKNHVLHAQLDAPSNDLTNKNISYQISDIKLGAGFAPDRVFRGQIADFNLETKSIDKHVHQLVRNFINVMIGLLAMFALFMFVRLGQQTLDKRAKIEFLSVFVLIGLLLAVSLHYIAAFYFGSTYPSNTFLFYALGGQFGDFYISLLQDATFAPYTSQVVHAQYFPFSYLLIYPLTKLSAHLALVLYTLFFIFCMYKFISHYTSKKNLTHFADKIANFKTTFILTFATYPMIFCLERGNLENLMFILVALAFYFYAHHKRWLTVIFLGMAGAMKLYPLFFIVYFISEKRYFEACMSVVLAVLLTLISLNLFDASFAASLNGWVGALTGMGHNILFLPDSCIHFNLGLWGLIKTFHLYKNLLANYSLPEIFKWYHFAALSGVAIVTLYVIFVEKLAWKKLFMLVSAILIFPEISNDYKLLYLLLPLVLFLENKPSRYDFCYLILFALFFIPKSNLTVFEDISLSTIMNPILLLVMMAAIIAHKILQTMMRTEQKAALAAPETLSSPGVSS